MLLFESTLPSELTWYAFEEGQAATGKIAFSPGLTEQISQLPRFDRASSFGYVLPHGGEQFREAITRLEKPALGALEAIAEHDPSSQVIAAAARAGANLRPEAAHLVLCETAIFQHLPAMAAQYALPAELRDLGYRRYGGQGLFHAWAWKQAAGHFPDLRRFISVRLSDNPSLTALLDGFPVETSDGFRASESLSTATSVGDLDPSVVLLLREIGKTPGEIEQMLTQQSGWSAIAGRPTTFLQLISATDEPTAFARSIFKHQLVKSMGAAMASLDGPDGILFGCDYPMESWAFVQTVCQSLEFASLELAESLQMQAETIELTTPSSRVRVFLVPYNRPLALGQFIIEWMRTDC